MSIGVKRGQTQADISKILKRFGWESLPLPTESLYCICTDEVETGNRDHEDSYESPVQTTVVCSTSSASHEKDLASQTGYASTRRIDNDGYYEGSVRSDGASKDRAAYTSLIKENRQVEAGYTSTKRKDEGGYYEAALQGSKLSDQSGYASLKPMAVGTESLYTSTSDGYEKPGQQVAFSNASFEKGSDPKADDYEKPVEHTPSYASVSSHTSAEDPYYIKLVG